MMLQCNFQSITLPKLGNSVDENEDNILEPIKSEIEFETLVRFAISDGATESFFSKQWSDILVRSYKDNSFEKDHLLETIKNVSAIWHSKTTSIDLPWYAEQKAETGAFATFLGLTINREKNTFETVAIGDCTLFQIRNDELLHTFPIASVGDFGNRPNLIASTQKYQSDLEKTVTYFSGSIHHKDIMIIATDALAAWIFNQNNAGEKPWNHLANILDNYKIDFENWLNNQRQINEIKNDDVTLLIIKFE